MQNFMKKGHLGILLTLLLTFIFAGCDKSEETVINEELLEETAFAENVFAQLSTDVEDAVPFEGISSGRFGFWGFAFGFNDCMTRTVETPEDADYPKTITIEYDGDCNSGLFGVVKSGKIIITLTGPPFEEGSERIVTFENFTVNGNLIEGTKTFTYEGHGQFHCVLEHGKITTPEGDVIIRESTRTRTLVEGGDTEDRSDDVYEITGVVTGETSDGTSYKKEIVEPLVVSHSCFWITQGVIVTTMGDASVTTDFGDGTCDNIMTRMDEDGNVEELTMDMHIHRMMRHQHQHQHQHNNG